MASVFKRNGKGNYLVSYFDHSGRRREKSSRTTDKRSAERIAAKLESDAALRREGVVDPRQDRFIANERIPLAKHIEAYLDHCEHVGESPKYLAEKRRHLGRLCAEPGAHRMSDLTVDLVEKCLRSIKDDGLSARTINYCRQIAVAFINWAVRTDRIEANALTVIPKLDKSQDRRRIRRPLTDDELCRLLSVAEPRGRKLWYLMALWAGFRKSDLEKIRWSDIDLEQRTITVRDGKAKRVDFLAMHPQLAEELQRRRDEVMATPQVRVFPQAVRNNTQLKDFLHAGIAREEVIIGDDGQPVMIGKGKLRRPKTKIVTEDAEGRVVDLHAMRTTLGTMLARQGTKPQVAREIMRHSDYKTTLKHYTVLGLSDTTGAIDELPYIGRTEPVKATGTLSASPNPPQIPPQLEHETMRNGASQCEIGRVGVSQDRTNDDVVNAASCETKRTDATSCDKAGDGIRTHDVQLGKLAFYH